MATNTDTMWEKWGEQNPYYGVLTDSEYRAENVEKHKDAFFQTGSRHIERALTDLAKRFDFQGREAALDFGCGVGRLVVPLAGMFGRVDGIDVSPSMLKEAAANVADRGLTNAGLLTSDDGLTALAGRQYDFVHSYNVLQHIPSARGYVLIDQLLSHVAPGGSFCLHVSVKKQYSKLGHAVYFVRHHVPGGYMLLNLLQRNPLRMPTMQMNDYRLEKLVPIFQKHGFGDVAFRPEYHPTRNGSVLTVVFFSKREPQNPA